MLRFAGHFTQQEPIGDDAIAAAIEVLKSGRLHRYNLVPGEAGEVAALETEFAAWQGTQFALAVTSGGQAMQIAFRAAGIQKGDVVLTNAFTLAPVPGAIEAVGGQTILVEIDENLRLDIQDLARKAAMHGARFLLLSHMRGHLCDMDGVVSICQEFGITIIEDCAHTMGAKWNGTRSGNFGLAGCFSTQTYKHINSGEGGLISSNDPEFMARAIINSGSYMLYQNHGAAPHADAFQNARLDMPNCSARMDALRAAILRPQLADIDHSIDGWNARYQALAEVLSGDHRIQLPKRPDQEFMVGSSLQFRVPQLGMAECPSLLTAAEMRGVILKWFGRNEPDGFTSNHQSWRYLPCQNLPQSDAVMQCLFDVRLPLTFTLDDCRLIGAIVIEALDEIGA